MGTRKENQRKFKDVSVFSILLRVCLSSSASVTLSVEDSCFPKDLKSKICFRVSEKSLAINSLATKVCHMLEMAMTESKCIVSMRRGYFCCLTPMYSWCGVMPVRSCLNVLFFLMCMMREFLRSELLV